MSNFLQKKKITKCTTCPLHKKNKVEVKFEKNLKVVRGNGEILIITDMIEYEKNFQQLDSFLQKYLQNYTIITGLQCRTKKFELDSPVAKFYKHCNNVGDVSKYKVIITIGRAINALTKNSDIVGWSEFQEYQFNQTYFYYQGKRVYPLPILPDWLEKDNFEKHYVGKQLLFIHSYLKNYETEKQKDIVAPYEIIKVDDPNKFLLDNLDKPVVSWDTETNSLDPFIDDLKIKCMTVSFDGVNGYYLPFDKINKRVLAKFFAVEREYLTANGSYDVVCMDRVGVKNAKVTEDVTIIWHLLNTDRLLNGIKSLAWYIGFGGYEEDLDNYKTKYKINDYTQIPEQVLMPYATLDVIVTYRLWEEALRLSKLQPLVYKNYKEVVIPAIPIYIEMQLEGMMINVPFLNQYNSELESKLKILEAGIKEEIGDIDINSTQQLARRLEELGLPEIERSEKEYYKDAEGNKKYFYKTGIKILETWKLKGYDIVDKLIEYRKLEKIRNTFVGEYEVEEKESSFLKGKTEKKKEEGLVKFIRKGDKVHPKYNVARTSAWRQSCSSPNAQQFLGTEEYRQIFNKPEGYDFFKIDISGFHLRITALVTGDEKMLEVFNSHGDLHSLTAHSIFKRNITFEEFMKDKKTKYKEYRDQSKGINFLYIYLGSSYSFAKDTIAMNWTEKEMDDYIKENRCKKIYDKQTNILNKPLTVATDIRKTFFDTYKIEEYLKESAVISMQRGYAESLQGGRRHFPRGLYTGEDTSRSELSGLESETVNAPILIYEAIYMNERMIRVYKEFKRRRLKSKIIAQIHDEIDGYVHHSEKEEVYHILKDNMEEHELFDLPFTAEVKYGDIFGFGKEINSDKGRR